MVRTSIKFLYLRYTKPSQSITVCIHVKPSYSSFFISTFKLKPQKIKIGKFTFTVLSVMKGDLECVMMPSTYNVTVLMKLSYLVTKKEDSGCPYLLV